MKPAKKRFLALAAAAIALVPGAAVLSTTGAAGACRTTVVAAGDHSPPLSFLNATAAVAAAQNPSATLVLGDQQYPDGSLAQYQAGYGTSGWASLPNVTPIPGNHEYRTAGASGYYTFFASQLAGEENGSHYYARDLGCGWRYYALNSEEALAPQVSWVTADLAANPNARVIVGWHKPRYSSGEHGDIVSMQPLIDATKARAKFYLWGHDHNYERGVTSAIKWFVVGTGGDSTATPPGPLTAGSKKLIANTPGIAKLTLTDTFWKVQFLNTAGASLDQAAFKL